MMIGAESEGGFFMTGRYFTLNVIIRKNQIEAAHGLDIGEDETQLHSV